MREAMGGALLLKLVMIFIVIYVCFLAIAINYSITFRVKNQIINLIEAYEGLENAEESIENYVNNIGYFRGLGTVKRDENCNYAGYCIYEIDSARGKYYRVVTYVSFDFPVLGQITNFPVSGETKVIYKPE